MSAGRWPIPRAHTALPLCPAHGVHWIRLAHTALRRRRAHAALRLALALAALAVAPPDAAAQRPAELVGRIVEQATGAPVEGARVELVEAGLDVFSDAAGRFRFRGVEPGRYTLRVVRLGYRPRTLMAQLGNGRTERLDVALVPEVLALDALRVTARRAAPAGAIEIGREAIERSGATSAGDVLRAIPGVVVRSTTPGGAQTVSIRGSGADAVLVLVDGVAINDPITGEADLSGVSAATIESVTVLSGAQSARYGPRAEAGAILIETRQAAGDRALSAGLGSLAAREARAEWSETAPVDWSAGAAWRSLGGGFDFSLPPEVGGGRRRRENADLEALDAWVAAALDAAGGSLRIRGGAESMDRGLPGKGFAPSRTARQRLGRVRASASWRRDRPGGALTISLAGVRHAVRFRDPAPPFGTPYDDRTTVHSVELRTALERSPASGLVSGYGAGAEARWQRIETDLLAGDAPARRLDLGVFAHGALGTRVHGADLSLAAQLRADRDPLDDRWMLSRSLTLGLAGAHLAAHIANRSSYSPPALGDQFFRDAVGVEPNPDLRAERVPSEIELGVRAHGAVGPVVASVGLTLYQGDIRDMIVWAPDYRFIWSPRNFDVKRRGAELHAEVEAFRRRLRVTASHAYARVTYDRGGADDTVQVIYRPRHTATLNASWQADAWRADVTASFTGKRYPSPAPVNALPGFWAVSVGAERDWRLGDWSLTTTLRADRLFDQKSSLIFGFPEPGRVLRLGLRLEYEPRSINFGPVDSGGQ
ncbi:MAG TPA: TonB-dependent receptor [Longimicrobiales bacterium]